MQGATEKSRKYTAEIKDLFNKVSRLRRKLLRFGYSSEETITIILEEFLKLPKVDWENLTSTPTFYDVKDKYRTDTTTSEMIMCLQKIVPNFHAPEVYDYLMRMLEYNSLAFGFNLLESSSDSNESNSALHRRLLQNKKRRLKNPKQIPKQKKNHDMGNEHQNVKGRKKLNSREQVPILSKDNQNKDVMLNDILSSKPDIIFHHFNEDIQKQLRIIKDNSPEPNLWKQEQQSEQQYTHKKK